MTNSKNGFSISDILVNTIYACILLKIESAAMLKAKDKINLNTLKTIDEVEYITGILKCLQKHYSNGNLETKALLNVLFQKIFFIKKLQEGTNKIIEITEEEI